MLSGIFSADKQYQFSGPDLSEVHAALGSELAGVQAFAEHTKQLSQELKSVQSQAQADRTMALQEKNDLEARWLQRLRVVRVESALRAGLAARDLRAAGRTLRLWVTVVQHLKQNGVAEQQQREQAAQTRLRDTGRAELLAERTGLARHAASSALAAQQLRASLSSRSQELERTIVRDTMAFELWASDVLRTKSMLEASSAARAEAEATAMADATALREELATAKRDAVASRAHAEAATARVMGSEIASFEMQLRVRAANQIVVVRLARQQSALHRCWTTWASVASLVLREAGGALLQLELAKQQQRGVHTRVQAELAAEAAVARVENVEARTMLSKASVLEQLRPGHELATDKELLHEQSRALQAAHASAAAAHLVAAAHRVGERALSRELLQEEAAAAARPSADTTAAPGRLPSRGPQEQSSIDFLSKQEAHTAAGLRRAGCELRVLVRSLQSMEGEMANATAAPRASAKPREASPRAARPAPGKGAARPPRAQAKK